MMTSYYRPDNLRYPGDGPGCSSAVRPERPDTGTTSTPRSCYDHFTPLVLPQLEELGFCKPGEAKDFIREGNLEIGGRLPSNTHGGQVGEAYLHGVNGIAEGVRLVRGTSTNQPEGVENVLVTAGTAVPTSGLVLGAV